MSLGKIVRECAVYAKSAEIEDGSADTFVYDGTRQSFLDAVKLNKRGEEIQEILNFLGEKKTFDDLLLDLVDFVVIQRMGLPIVRINRVGGVNKSGRCIALDLVDYRRKSWDVKQDESVNPGIVMIIASAILTLAIAFNRK